MEQALPARQIQLGARRIGSFWSWLCGQDPDRFRVLEELSTLLPAGITIQGADGEQLGKALKTAMMASDHQPAEILKSIFSHLAGSEKTKAEAVMKTVIPFVPAETVSEFVRVAAKARPSLALAVARVAAAMRPEQSQSIAMALESVVAGSGHLLHESDSGL